MSTEIPQTPPTTPVVPPKSPTSPTPGDGPVQPDNWHTEGTTEAPVDGLLTGNPAKKTPAKPGQVNPDNWHTESEPQV